MDGGSKVGAPCHSSATPPIGPNGSRHNVAQSLGAVQWEGIGTIGQGPDPCQPTIGLCMLCHPALGCSTADEVAGAPLMAWPSSIGG
jgi:hypothetical protein